MRKIRYCAPWSLISAVAALLSVTSTQAQTVSPDSGAPLYPPYYAPSQSSVYNQSSVYLPAPPVAQGQDMVRGSNGVSCQTAIGSGGPYVDIGVIGSQDVFNRDTASVYGRVVVPLGKRPKRPDCTKLYDLEIARMRMEIELLRMGLPADIGGIVPAAARVDDHTMFGEPVTINPTRRQASATVGASTENPKIPTPTKKETDGLGDGLRTIFRLAPG